MQRFLAVRMARGLWAAGRGAKLWAGLRWAEFNGRSRVLTPAIVGKFGRFRDIGTSSARPQRAPSPLRVKSSGLFTYESPMTATGNEAFNPPTGASGPHLIQTRQIHLSA